MRDYEQRKAAFIYRCHSHNGHDICMCGEPHSTHGDYTGCMVTWGYLSDRQKMDLHIRKMEIDMQMDMQKMRMGDESRADLHQLEDEMLLEKQKELMAKFMPMVQQTVNLAARLTPVAPKCKVNAGDTVWFRRNDRVIEGQVRYVTETCIQVVSESLNYIDGPVLRIDRKGTDWDYEPFHLGDCIQKERRYSQILQEPDEPAEQPKGDKPPAWEWFRVFWDYYLPSAFFFAGGSAMSFIWWMFDTDGLPLGISLFLFWLSKMSLPEKTTYDHNLDMKLFGLSRDWKWKRRPKAAKKPMLSSKEPLSPPSV